MPTSIQALANAAKGVSLPSKSASEEIVIWSVCVSLCLLVNPLLALFILAVLAVFFRVPTSAFFISVPISFALFFYFRDYGVEWAPGSGDDVPGYVLLYQENAFISFSGIFGRFLETPGSGEPLWHILWWPLLNVIGGSDEMFIFLHYLLIFVAAFLSFFVLSKRYFIAFSLVYFFATPLSIESVTYLWRQQLAFSLFLAGIGLYMVHGRQLGRLVIYISPLMHVSMVFFIAIFLAFELYKKYVGLDSKLKFLLIAIINLSAITIVAPFAINYLGSLGLERLASYFEGSGEDQRNVFISVSIYSLFLFMAHLKLKNDDVNNLFIVVLFAVFGLMLAFPGATGIYIRFLIFAFPLYGLYFFRCYLMNFSTRWLVPVMFLIFISGTIRMYRPTLEDIGVVRYLAFGHPFDPFMGVVKMLVSFPLS
jgi:hypothetical protein